MNIWYFHHSNTISKSFKAWSKMIKNLILINSANFNYLDVNLEKDLFFLGDNGSGKTTVIRAIHYLFSGDVRNLGIPTDKDGFKEYYFRYPNSYMIYIFEDFFIFMYKTSGEIVKLFSKQKFDRSRIIDEDSNLYELDVIKKYAKEANLKKTVKSLSQYRDIIYGNDKKLLDFKFTSIKNSDIFIGLFNEIFNIDKSIIDSKSIKKAIQTTLNHEKRVIEFDHEKYLQDIYTFQSQYKFFREFEKQKETIDTAFSLKNILKEYEDELNELLSYILHSSQKEALMLQQSKEEHIEVDKKLSLTKRFKIKRVNTLKKCKERFQSILNKLNLDIQRIRELKVEFSQENILLKSGFEDELASITAEIKSLEYKRDRELPREMEDKKENQKKFLRSKLDESLEKDELDIRTKESSSKIEIENIKEEIRAFNVDIDNHKKTLEILEKEHKKSSKLLTQEYEEKIRLKKELIEKKNTLVYEKTRNIQTVKYEIEELQRVKEKTLLLNKDSYEEEKQRILKEIQKYRSMINSKPDSFKEFLNEEVDGWESELYPLLDETLLDMSSSELQPKLLDTQRVVALELNTKILKKILTKDEAELKISTHELESENLKRSYEESVETIETKHKQESETQEQKIEFLKSDIETIKVEIDLLEDEMLSLNSTLENDLKIKTEIYTKKMKITLNDIEVFSQEIQNSNDAIYEIEEELRERRRAQKNRVKDLEFEFEEELKEVYKQLCQWLNDEKIAVDSLIVEQESKKESITKDERIKELENSLAKIKEEYFKA